MAFADPANTSVHPAHRALPETDLILAHESALVAAGAALQEAALSRAQYAATAAQEARSHAGLKFLRYLFLKRFG